MKDLQKAVIEFRDKRNWRQFHTPKDLALAICSEAGELADLLLWDRPVDKDRIGQEMADILIYLLSMADVTGIDLGKAVYQKLLINNFKYPVGESYGKSSKYK